MRFLLVCSSLISLSYAADDNSQFLFNNAVICKSNLSNYRNHCTVGGEPFADPMWIPVLDMCDISCDPLKEYCVENDELKQMCKPSETFINLLGLCMLKYILNQPASSPV